MIDQITSSVFFGSSITLIAYVICDTIKSRYNKDILNPILFSIILIGSILILFDIDFDTYYNSAQYLSYFLTPATICLALPLYKQLSILKKNILAIVIGITTGVLTSLVSIMIISKLLSLSVAHYATLLPKSITIAIGLPISIEFGGIGEITVVVTLLTGVFGNLIAKRVVEVSKIKSPIAKGIAIGTASHAIGTAKAMEIGELEGATSSLSIVLSGIITVILMQYFM